MVLDVQVAQLAVDFMQELEALVSRASAIKLNHHSSQGAGESSVPVEVEFLCGLLAAWSFRATKMAVRD